MTPATGKIFVMMKNRRSENSQDALMGNSPGQRVPFILARAEVKAVDDWRFAKRMPNRASAIRELLKRGLIAEGFDVPPTANRRSNSD